jgi:hypothetical protein
VSFFLLVQHVLPIHLCCVESLSYPDEQETARFVMGKYRLNDGGCRKDPGVKGRLVHSHRSRSSRGLLSSLWSEQWPMRGPRRHRTQHRTRMRREGNGHPHFTFLSRHRALHPTVRPARCTRLSLPAPPFLAGPPLFSCAPRPVSRTLICTTF